MSAPTTISQPTAARQQASNRRERVFSGIKPSGTPTLGNYIGAIRNWVAEQDLYDNIYSVVDLHAITVPQDPKELRANSRQLAALLFASGIDPERSALFIQSHVHEHAELTWILNCMTPLGWLNRMTQFKSKVGDDREAATTGLYDYPVLMAADILLYQTDVVPVGEDQRQHVELTRDLAQRFNSRFGDTFVVPEPYILKATAKILDLQEPAAKMSKSSESQAGVIDLLDEPASIAKKIKRAVTDTETQVRFDEANKPGVSNLLTIFSVLSGRSIAELESAYEGQGYGALKSDLAEVVVDFTTPLRERTNAWLADSALDDVLRDGAERARKVAGQTLERVYDAIGFLPTAR